MSLEDAFKDAGISKLTISPGDIWLVKDAILNFPEGKKTEKDLRPVIVLANAFLCKEYACLTVMVAPFSSKTKWASSGELFINPTQQNGLNMRSRLMLGHIQPIVKTRLERKLGTLSGDEWDAVVDQVIWNIYGK